MRSKIERMKKAAKMLRRHRTLRLDWFEAKGRMPGGVVLARALKRTTDPSALGWGWRFTWVTVNW
jgi:hypothetical protein